MSMKKKALMGASYVLVAAMAIGGTVAFLTDTDEDINVMTLGNVQIEQHEYERVVDGNGGYTIDNGSYVLQEFTQFKPLLPATDPSNNGAGGWDSTTVKMSQVDSYGSMQVFENKNAQDKFVTVENTGRTDAYVRTLVAMEIGNTDGSLVGYSHRSSKDAAGTKDPWLRNNVGTITIDDNNYALVEFIYKGAQKSNGTFVHKHGVLPAGDTTYPSVCQFYLKGEATNEDVEALDGNDNGLYDILVVSQAVQADGFADAKTALDQAFGEITTTAHPWVDKDFLPETITGTDEAEVKEAFKDAVTAEKGQIVINLESDVTYDVAAWAVNGMGGSITDEIIINGNGHTITFNNTDSDWNNIVTNNGAKLYINNATITNSGEDATSGTWNAHDINFACEVVLNNVTSLNALAFKNNAKLTDVTIYDDSTSDSYAIWIQAKGLNVELDGCTIDSTGASDGRGIKIDNQYVVDQDTVKNTLVVKNTRFITEEKAAILVKSVAGADITLDNVDISGVAADSENAVWVDADAKDYSENVTVTGGSKITES